MKIVNETLSQDRTYNLQQTTANLFNSLKFANQSQELFVASCGEPSADSLRFFNADGLYREIKRI